MELEDESDMMLVQFRLVPLFHTVNRLVHEIVFPLVGIIEHPDDIHDSGFSRTARPHHSYKFSFINVQVNPFQNEGPLKTGFNKFVYVPKFNHICNFHFEHYQIHANPEITLPGQLSQFSPSITVRF